MNLHSISHLDRLSNKLIMKRFSRLLVLAVAVGIFAFYGNTAMAQPANDDVCNATGLLVEFSIWRQRRDDSMLMPL